MTNPTDKLPGLRCLLKWPLQIKMAELSLWAWLPFFCVHQIKSAMPFKLQIYKRKRLKGQNYYYF